SAQLDRLVWDKPPPGVAEAMRCNRVEEENERSFFSVVSEQLTRHYQGFDVPHDVTGNVVRLKNGIDTQVIVIGYVRGRDPSGAPDIHLLLNVGNRQLITREFGRHPVQTEEPDRSIEPWYFYS